MAQINIEPWDKSTDSQYTWTQDTSKINILPSTKDLAWNEVLGYFPVTARTQSFEIRASGDVVFSVQMEETRDADYNSHTLSAITTNNTSGSIQRSAIKIVGYDGVYAYSAVTYLNKATQPAQPSLDLFQTAITLSSAATEVRISVNESNCTFSRFTYTTGGTFPITASQSGRGIYFAFQANQEDHPVTGRVFLTLYDTNNNAYDREMVITLQASAQPAPSLSGTPGDWDQSTDSQYTWYKDENLIKILPATKTLSYDESEAYWPVTAHGFTRLEVRASGDVVFSYVLDALADASYNSHELYAHPDSNTGTTQLVSEIMIVGFSGSSAYSASTVLMQNPATQGWITASPSPVVGPGQGGSVTCFLTLTNCSRSINDELTGNTQLNDIDWLTVNRISDTAITFTFAANTTRYYRETYYYAYGRDEADRMVYKRIVIQQEPGAEASITLTPSRTSLGYPAGSFTLNIKSTNPGTFSFTAASWMRITSVVTASSSESTLYIDYYKNENEWTRTGNIDVSQQISTSPYTLTASVTISQEAETGQTAGFLTVNPTAATVDRTAGYTQFQVNYSSLATVPALLEGEGNMSITSYRYEDGLITIVYGENNAALPKQHSFVLTASSTNGDVLTANIELTQLGTGLKAHPVWRDYPVEMTGASYVNYTISYDGEIIYTGRAYKYPDADRIVIYLNKLIKNYLNNYISFDEGYYTVGEWLGNFVISSPELGDIDAVAFYEDYSYENREETDPMSLNDPITGEVPEGGLVPFSFFCPGSNGYVEIISNKPRQ